MTTNIIRFQPRPPRAHTADRWPTIYVVADERGGWCVHELSASGDSGVFIDTARTKAGAIALARAARRLAYGAEAHLHIGHAGPEGAA